MNSPTNKRNAEEEQSLNSREDIDSQSSPKKEEEIPKAGTTPATPAESPGTGASTAISKKKTTTCSIFGKNKSNKTQPIKEHPANDRQAHSENQTVDPSQKDAKDPKEKRKSADGIDKDANVATGGTNKLDEKFLGGLVHAVVDSDDKKKLDLELSRIAEVENLKRTDHYKRNILHKAALDQNPKLIKELIEKAREHMRPTLAEKADSRFIKFVKYISARAPSKKKQVHIDDNNEKVVEEYLNMEDLFGNTPLMLACINNNNKEKLPVKVNKKKLNKEDEENENNEEENKEDKGTKEEREKKERTLKRAYCINELLLNKVEVNKQNRRTLWTPLTWCAFYGDIISTKLLLGVTKPEVQETVINQPTDPADNKEPEIADEESKTAAKDTKGGQVEVQHSEANGALSQEGKDNKDAPKETDQNKLKKINFPSKKEEDNDLDQPVEYLAKAFWPDHNGLYPIDHYGIQDKLSGYQTEVAEVIVKTLIRQITEFDETEEYKGWMPRFLYRKKDKSSQFQGNPNVKFKPIDDDDKRFLRSPLLRSTMLYWAIHFRLGVDIINDLLEMKNCFPEMPLFSVGMKNCFHACSVAEDLTTIKKLFDDKDRRYRKTMENFRLHQGEKNFHKYFALILNKKERDKYSEEFYQYITKSIPAWLQEFENQLLSHDPLFEMMEDFKEIVEENCGPTSPRTSKLAIKNQPPKSSARGEPGTNSEANKDGETPKDIKSGGKVEAVNENIDSRESESVRNNETNKDGEALKDIESASKFEAANENVKGEEPVENRGPRKEERLAKRLFKRMTRTRKNGHILKPKSVRNIPLYAESKDKFGNTPLHTASFLGQSKIVHYFLSKGINYVTENNDGWRCIDLKQHDFVRLFIFIASTPNNRSKAYEKEVKEQEGKLNRIGLNDIDLEQMERIRSRKSGKDAIIPDIVLVFKVPEVDPNTLVKGKEKEKLKVKDHLHKDPIRRRVNFNINLIQKSFNCYMAQGLDPTIIFLMIKLKEKTLIEECHKNKVMVKLVNDYNYQPFDKNEKTSFEPFRSRQRQEITLNSLSNLIDIEQLIQLKVIQSVYQMHTVSGLESIRKRWIKRKKWFVIQPLNSFFDYIREGPSRAFKDITILKTYYGEKFSFYFAWVSFIICYLPFLAVPGLLIYSVTKGYPKSIDIALPVWVMYNSIFITFLVERWKRKSSEIAVRWGTLDMLNQKLDRKVIRKEYSGDEVISESTGALTKYNKQNYKWFYFLCGTIILLIVSAFIILLFLGTQQIKLKYPHLSFIENIGVSTINGFVIAILNTVYAFAVQFFVKKENHKYQDDYEKSLIFKTVLFKALTSYLGVFYLTFITRESFDTLFSTLLSLLVTKQVSSTFTMLGIPWLQYKWMKKNPYFQTSIAEQDKVDGVVREKKITFMTKVKLFFKNLCKKKEEKDTNNDKKAVVLDLIEREKLEQNLIRMKVSSILGMLFGNNRKKKLEDARSQSKVEPVVVTEETHPDKLKQLEGKNGKILQVTANLAFQNLVQRKPKTPFRSRLDAILDGLLQRTPERIQKDEDQSLEQSEEQVVPENADDSGLKGKGLEATANLAFHSLPQPKIKQTNKTPEKTKNTPEPAVDGPSQQDQSNSQVEEAYSLKEEDYQRTQTKAGPFRPSSAQKLVGQDSDQHEDSREYRDEVLETDQKSMDERQKEAAPKSNVEAGEEDKKSSLPTITALALQTLLPQGGAESTQLEVNPKASQKANKPPPDEGGRRRAVLDCQTGKMSDLNWEVTSVELNYLRPVKANILDYYSDALIQFGYITMFSPAFTLGPAIAFFLNILDTKAKLFAFLNFYKRPLSEKAGGIGDWLTAWEIISIFALFFNALSLFFNLNIKLDFVDHIYPNYQNGTTTRLEIDQNINRLWLFAFVLHVILILKVLVIIFIEDKPSWVVAIEEKIEFDEEKAIDQQRDQEIVRQERAKAKRLKELTQQAANTILTGYELSKETDAERKDKNTNAFMSEKKTQSLFKTKTKHKHIFRPGSPETAPQAKAETVGEKSSPNPSKIGKRTRKGKVRSIIKASKVKLPSMMISNAIKSILFNTYILVERDLLYRRISDINKATEEIIVTCDHCQRFRSVLECHDCAAKFCNSCFVEIHRKVVVTEHNVVPYGQVKIFTKESLNKGFIPADAKPAGYLAEYLRVNKLTMTPNFWRKFELYSFPMRQSMPIMKSLKECFANLYEIYFTSNAIEAADALSNWEKPLKFTSSEDKKSVEEKKKESLGDKLEGAIDFSYEQALKKFTDRQEFNTEEKLLMNEIAFLVFRNKSRAATFGIFYGKLKILQDKRFDKKVELILDLVDQDGDGYFTHNEVVNFFKRSFIQNIIVPRSKEPILGELFQDSMMISKEEALQKIFQSPTIMNLFAAYTQQTVKGDLKR